MSHKSFDYYINMAIEEDKGSRLTEALCIGCDYFRIYPPTESSPMEEGCAMGESPGSRHCVRHKYVSELDFIIDRAEHLQYEDEEDEEDEGENKIILKYKLKTIKQRIKSLRLKLDRDNIFLGLMSIWKNFK